ncbi:MAG: Bifunctional protein Aas [Planctomycetes bacterium]|nr:Bifunctional protein Aas [Planctomycetota bacterium]
MLYAVSQALVRLVGRLCWRIRAEGRGNIPRTGAVILASTHESFLDPPVVGSFAAPRRPFHMARRTLFYSGETRSGFRTWLGRKYKVIEVDREGTGLGALRDAEAKLRQGETVLIFPEGTRSTDGSVQRFRAGVGLLAVRTGAAVVPVSVDGTRGLWGRGRKAPRLFGGPVRLCYGTPLTFGETTEPDDAADAIRSAVIQLRERTDIQT